MKITIEQFEKLGACSGGIEWLKTQKSLSVVDLIRAAIEEKKFKTSEGETEDTLDYANWTIVRIMDQRQKTRYACFAARQCLLNYTDRYPNDKRVLAAIEAAEKWVAESTEANESARSAESAAESAESAESAAESAAWSARSAAWSATRSARSAAGAKVRMMEKILRYGVKILLEKGEKC